MPIIPAIRYRFLKLFPRVVRRSVLRKIGTSPFGVVSNNCWGAHIYQTVGVAYMTPFIGLAMSTNSYLRLLSNWNVVWSPLRFTEKASEERMERMRQERGTFWPVGVLADKVEIHFMHYRTCDEAGEKWQRRLKRMPQDVNRLFVKFDDYDGLSSEQFNRFAGLKFAHKVCFTANRDWIGRPGVVHIPTLGGRLPDGLALSRVSPSYFDSAAWIGGLRQPSHSLFSFV